MTGKKTLLFFLIQLVIFTLAKLWLFNGQVFSSQALQNIVYWAILAVVSVALVRRFGIISYFEAIFTLFIWIVADLVLDLAFTSNYTGLSMFYQKEYWFGFLVMIVAVMLFHKKRHVEIRKQLHAKKHAQEGRH